MISTIFICFDCFLIVMYTIFRISKALRKKINSSMGGFVASYVFSLLIGSILGTAYYYLGGYVTSAGFSMYSIIGFVYHFTPFFLIQPLLKLYREFK